MAAVLFDNLVVIALALSGIWSAEWPVIFLICAGLLMVAVTAASMGSRFGMVLFLLAIGFSVSGGSFISFAVLALLNEIRPLFRALIAFFGFLLYKTVSLIATDKAGGENFAMSVLYAFIMLGIMLIIMLIQYLIATQLERANNEKERLTRANLSELHERQLNRELVERNYLAEKNARLLERENISRNIHNSVGHSITAAIMTLDAADMLYDVKPDEARKRMNDANDRIRGSLDSIRRAVRTLDEEGKPVSLNDLISDFNGIIEEFVMDTEIRVDRNYEILKRENEIPHEHAEFLTGVLKELLTNGLKHGNADYYIVTVSGDSAHLRLSVKDNGKSDFSEENESMRIEKGFGIKKMQDYVSRLGGRTEFKNENGFRAVVEIPIYEK